MSRTKVSVLRELCKKATGKQSKGQTVVEVLQDLLDALSNPNMSSGSKAFVDENGRALVTEDSKILISE